MIRRPPRSTQSRSSAASDVYKRQERSRHAVHSCTDQGPWGRSEGWVERFHKRLAHPCSGGDGPAVAPLSLIHISEPTRRTPISYAVFCLKKKKKQQTTT